MEMKYFGPLILNILVVFFLYTQVSNCNINVNHVLKYEKRVDYLSDRVFAIEFERGIEERHRKKGMK